MTREYLNIPEEEIEDFTNENCTWEINGEKYEYIDKTRTDGDGEWFAVVVQRKSDGKYFQFKWGIGWSQNYHYSPQWSEVKPKVVTITTYGWDKND